ncbi:MAG: hypothetical protein QG642_10 [Patescibacteria group bacterium]|nr:hypothetical protein [Patescibacteria group bacterium]
MPSKQKTLVKAKVNVGVPIKTKILLFVVMTFALSSGLFALVPLATRNTKLSSTSSVCKPATPRLTFSGKSVLRNSVDFNIMRMESTSSTLRLQRSEKIGNGDDFGTDEWGPWTAVKATNNVYRDLDTYPNKEYKYRALAYNPYCNGGTWSDPSEEYWLHTYDYVISWSNDQSQDPDVAGTVKNINDRGNPFDSEASMNLAYIYKEDACTANPSDGGKNLIQYSIQKDDYSGPMGGIIRSVINDCPYGCFNGRCVGVNETCPAGWYCIEPNVRAQVNSNCTWINLEQDRDGFVCQDGDWVSTNTAPIISDPEVNPIQQ